MSQNSAIRDLWRNTSHKTSATSEGSIDEPARTVRHTGRADESRSTWRRLFARFDRLRPRGEPVRRESSTFHALDRLDVAAG
jgi:hypothetical protein